MASWTWVGPIWSMEGLNRTKDWVRMNFDCPTDRAGASVFSCSWTRTYTTSFPDSQAFGLRLEFTSLAFLDLQLTDSRSWYFSAHLIAWVNFYNKSLFLPPCVCVCARVCWFGSCFSRESWQIHRNVWLISTQAAAKALNVDIIFKRVH